MIKLRYGNTNTFLLCGEAANLLIDTDYAGTLPAFYKEIKKHGIDVRDITYVIFDFVLSDEDMAEIAKVNKNKRYYTATPEMIAAYANMELRPDL